MFGLIFFLYLYLNLSIYKDTSWFMGRSRKWKIRSSDDGKSGEVSWFRVIISGASQENNNTAFTPTPRGNVFRFGTNVDQIPRFTLKTLKHWGVSNLQVHDGSLTDILSHLWTLAVRLKTTCYDFVCTCRLFLRMFTTDAPNGSCVCLECRSWTSWEINAKYMKDVMYTWTENFYSTASWFPSGF